MDDSVDLYQPSEDVGAPRREIHLSEYWAVLVERRKLIAACAAIAIALAIVRCALTRPTYEATVVLHVDKDKGSLLDVNSLDQFASGYEPEFLPTQMRLMRSREIAERVVQKLNLLADRDFMPRKAAASPSAPQRDAPAEASPGQLRRAAGRVQDCLGASTIRGTNLVELTCSAPTPRLAADITNATAEAYIDWNLESKFRIVGQASQFLTGQIEQIKGELQDKEKDLLAYGREKDIISTDPRTNVTMQKLETLNKDYAAAVSDRVAKEARYYETRNASPEGMANSLSSGLVSQLQSEVAKLERDYAEKLNLFKPEWPAMQELKIQIDEARQHLNTVIGETVTKGRESSRSEYTTALRREESLRNVLQSQKSEAMTLNTNAVEYNNLKIEVETKRTLLDGLLKKQAETEVMSRLRGERVSSIRIVDRAQQPGGRSAPLYRKNLMSGLALGLLAGAGLAFFLSYLDRSLRTPQQVEQYVKLPTLGAIPALATVPAPSAPGLKGLRRLQAQVGAGEPVSIELLPHREPRSTVAEAYRGFRAALLLARAGGVRSVVITSCLPEEGKTATAVNLAVVLTQLGKRVLLVDADLHRPRLHQVLNVSNKTGLVSVLAEGVEPSAAIVKTALTGLYVVPAGPTSPNPSGLLASDGMTTFLQLAQLNFDYVIVDTPPIFPISDVLVFAQQTDGVVLCARAGKTSREQVVRGRDLLLRSRASVLGVLLNNLDLSSATYRYAEGYGYAYYGEPEAVDESPAPAAQSS